MKKNLFFLAAAALMAAACSNEDGDKASMPAKINVKTTMSAAITRTSTEYQGAALDAASSPAIYVVKEGTTAITNGYFYQNITATVSGAALTTGSTTLYFPQDKTDVDVYVYAPKKDNVADLTAGISHTISSDQYTKANYLASDFVVGKQNVEYDNDGDATADEDQEVTIKLFHAMSKIKLVITDADGQTSTLGQLKMATLSNIKPTAVVYPVKSPGASDANSALATNETVGTASGDPVIVKLLDTDTDSSSEGATTSTTLYGIVPPQTLASALTLTIGNNTYATEANITNTLAPGYEYTFNVKLTQAELTVTSVTIEPWTSAGAGTDVDVK